MDGSAIWPAKFAAALHQGGNDMRVSHCYCPVSQGTAKWSEPSF